LGLFTVFFYQWNFHLGAGSPANTMADLDDDTPKNWYAQLIKTDLHTITKALSLSAAEAVAEWYAGKQFASGDTWNPTDSHSTTKNNGAKNARKFLEFLRRGWTEKSTNQHIKAWGAKYQNVKNEGNDVKTQWRKRKNDKLNELKGFLRGFDATGTTAPRLTAADPPTPAMRIDPGGVLAVVVESRKLHTDMNAWFQDGMNDDNTETQSSNAMFTAMQPLCKQRSWNGNMGTSNLATGTD